MIGALWNSYWLVPLHAALVTMAVVLGRRLAHKEEKDLGAPRQCRVGPFERFAGTMLAFLVGFTFAISGGHFRESQATVHRQSDAIAEADRWSRLFSETDRQWLRDNLSAYVDLLIRRDAMSKLCPQCKLVDQEIRSEQQKLWVGLAERRSAATERTAYDACLRAVNEFTQAYDLGYYLDRRRLPDVMVLFILGGTLLIGFLVGYTTELQGRPFAVMTTLFILFITAMVYLMWEVDRPSEGWITVGRQNLIDLADRLRRYSP